MIRPPLRFTLFPYTTLFRSSIYYRISSFPDYGKLSKINFAGNIAGRSERVDADKYDKEDARSEEHTSELQSPDDLVCRLLLEKKKHTILTTTTSKYP